MRILLANKFYYRRGGDCIYAMNLEKLLKEKGHEVAFYAMQFPENEPSEWSKYWPKNMSKVDAFTRPFGAKQVREGFSRLLDDFKPDVVHLNNIHTHLSPVIAEIAHERGIRVVWTLHDSKLSCPCYTCLRKEKTPSGSPCLGGGSVWCEECFTDKKAVIKHRCMPGGIIGSTIGYYEMKMWNKDRLQKCVDLFLPPSQFMMDIAVMSGYDAEKFRVNCNFIDVEKVKGASFEKEEYYTFLGRVTSVKGIRTLCEAASLLPYKLKVIGGGDLLDELREQYGESIEFLDEMIWEQLKPVMQKSKFMVLPSEWSENNPLTVIESQSLGTPVLGARIGGIPELIEEGVSGMTFESGNVADLKEKIVQMWNAKFDYEKLSENAIERYSSDRYIEKLLEYYKG